MEHHRCYNPVQSSLTEWSVTHIKAIFEAGSDEQAIRAIGLTFSDNVAATLNGRPLPRHGIDQLVLSMRKNSKLQVHWQHTSPVPNDGTNRCGSFQGTYVVSGIQKETPAGVVQFERHKNVSVKIDSISLDPHVDSRRIVQLEFVATDIRVDRDADVVKTHRQHM